MTTNQFNKSFEKYCFFGDTIEAEIEGFEITARIEQDEDYHIDNDDCHNTDQSVTGCTDEEFAKLLATREAWFKDEWHYCCVILSVSKCGVVLDSHAATLCGIEMNYPGSFGENSHLTEAANELIDEALERGKSVLAKITESPMTIYWNTDVNAPCCPGEIVDNETGKTILVQSDWDYPSTAETFGWNIREVQPDVATAHFDRFCLELPRDAVDDCSHSGDCTADVEAWATEIERPKECTPEALRAELAEYGAWDDEQLSSDEENWLRIVWIAASNIKENPCIHDETDGTVDCKICGCTVGDFINAAEEWLTENNGAEADDPGYF